MAVFGATPDVYTLPPVRLAVDGAPWLADAAVGSWSLERELVASTIPGNIRSRSGLSVGAASVTVRPQQRATPWSTAPATRVTTGAAASLYAEDADGSTLPLGAWVTAPTSGALTSEGVAIELREAQYVGKQKPQALEPYMGPLFEPLAPVDPAWAIGRLLDQAGFPSVPMPVPSAIVAAPLSGGLSCVSTRDWPAATYTAAGEVSWAVLDGDTAVGATSGSGLNLAADGQVGATPILDRFRGGGAVYVTLNVTGTVFLLDLAQGWMIGVINDPITGTHSVGVSNTLGALGDAKPFTPAQSADWPTRVQLQVQHTPAVTPGQWAQLAVRARSGPDAAWSAWSVHTSPHTPAADWLELIYVVGGVAIPGSGIPDPAPVGQFAALQVTTEADPALWAPARAHLKPLGADVGMPMVPPDLSAWTAVQDIASAYLAAVILDTTGVAKVLTRDDLAGVGIPGEPTDIGAEWADLAWELDPADSADRVEITYTPPVLARAVVGSSTWAPEVWRADEVITVPPKQLISIPVTLENRAAVNIFRRFVVPLDPSPWWSQSSTIIAFDNPEGAGEPASTSNFQASVRQTSATTAVIEVRNKAAVPLYLVDGTGQPCLILRAATVATYDTPRVVARGAAAEDAESPLAVDLGTWVQSTAEANEIADYLWSRVSGPGLWKVSNVKVRLDWRHDIGRVLAIRHPATGLVSKVLTTKVDLTGESGRVEQTLDLVLLPPTWADFDDAWNDATWAEFDAAWSAQTWADLDADPLKIGA